VTESLNPPKNLAIWKYVVFIYHRFSKTFVLALRDKKTYNLGGVSETRLYLQTVFPNDEYFVEDILDRVFNFYVVQVFANEHRIAQVTVPVDKEKLANKMLNEFSMDERLQVG